MNNSSTISARKSNLQNAAMPDENSPIYSHLLFAHGDVVLIQHQGEQYYLRRTRNGKLILTK